MRLLFQFSFSGGLEPSIDLHFQKASTSTSNCRLTTLTCVWCGFATTIICSVSSVYIPLSLRAHLLIRKCRKNNTNCLCALTLCLVLGQKKRKNLKMEENKAEPQRLHSDSNGESINNSNNNNKRQCHGQTAAQDGEHKHHHASPPESAAKSPPRTVRVAVGQICSVNNADSNFSTCRQLAEQAAAGGAQLLALPECFHFMGEHFSQTLAASESLEGGSMRRYRELAAEFKLWLSLGGFQERVASPPTADDDAASNGDGSSHSSSNNKIHNTHVIIDSSGQLKSVYRKIHLFDAEVPGGPSLKESSYTVPGSSVALADSPAGVLGLSTCYDLRFPELYTSLASQGAQVLLVPAAFTVPTGRAHWEVLLRARAIETQTYVLAAAQVGQHNPKRASWGHSMIIDPWGKVLADAGDQCPAVVFADIDLAQVADIRQRMPVQSHRKLHLFR